MEQPKTFPAAPPEVVYLQYYGDQDPRDAEGEPAEVTWCAERIFKHDLEYVPAGRSAPEHGKTESLPAVRCSAWLEELTKDVERRVSFLRDIDNPSDFEEGLTTEAEWFLDRLRAGEKKLL